MSMSNNEITNPALGGQTPEVNKPFDPLAELFIAQEARPAHLTEVNFRTLTPFQRSLLVIDGTVTKFIEAFTRERVEIIGLNQESQFLPADHKWLEAPQGTRVVSRQVLLRGKYSYTVHAYAISLTIPDRLPRNVREALKVDGEGLGRILLSSRMENRREVLWYGREQVAGLPDTIRQVTGNEFISRTYRIITGGKPIMLINEKFPANLDRGPVHH
jgi:chorismate-pyruvate lyase